MATAAAARPAGSGPHVGSPPGTWSSAPGHHGARGVRTGFGYGAIDRRGHHRGRRQDFVSYGAAGIAGQYEAADPYGNGFFTGGGGRIILRGGHPYYDYDRSYPYEWAPSAGVHEGWEEEEAHPAGRPAPRCTMENSVRVCRGR